MLSGYRKLSTMCNIVLEPLSLEDEESILFLYKTRGHPKICEYLLGKPPQDLESHKNWLHKNVPSKRLMFILKCNGEMVGYCHAYDFNKDENTLEVGFVIHPDYQGRGFGSIIVKKFLEKIYEIIPGQRVQLYVKVDNDKAIHIYQKYGFEMMSCAGNVVMMEKRNDHGTQIQEGGFCL